MAVIAAILLARVFAPEKLDDLFERTSGEQYTQDLLLSTAFDLMNEVVCPIKPSVQADRSATPTRLPRSSRSLPWQFTTS